MTESFFVIYWERSEDQQGFVSYDHLIRFYNNEYNPCLFMHASKYKTRELAEKTRNWYEKRGGFGLFIIMEVKGND